MKLPAWSQVHANARRSGLAGGSGVTGVERREFATDDAVYSCPTFGADGMVYVVPRGTDVVCGGTALDGVESTSPDPAEAERILARCRALVPALAGAQVLGHAVGVRPARPAVRLERSGDVVHCYGHGGAGVTLSWGCADEVTRLVG